VDGIREVDSTGSIGLISAEIDTPYDRPPLSKALWKGKPLDSTGARRKTKVLRLTLAVSSKKFILSRNVSDYAFRQVQDERYSLIQCVLSVTNHEWN